LTENSKRAVVYKQVSHKSLTVDKKGPVERFDREKQANYPGCTLICISTYCLFVLCLFIARYDHDHAEALAKDTSVVLNQNEKSRDRLKVAIALVDGVPKLLQINFQRHGLGFGGDSKICDQSDVIAAMYAM
jgi:hypothetical protein